MTWHGTIHAQRCYHFELRGTGAKIKLSKALRAQGLFVLR